MHRRHSRKVVRSSAPRRAACTPQGRRIILREQGRPRRPGIRAAGLARRLAQAYPLILERRVGGSQRSPWGTNTVAVVWTLVPAVLFGSPSSSLASGPGPSPTSLWAPGLRCHWPHAPTPTPAASTHTHNPQPPLDSALPARGPSTWPRTPVHRHSPGTPRALQPAGPRPVPTHQRPSSRAQQACFSLRTSLTQQQADASPGYPQPCRLASRPAPVLGPAGPRVLPTHK